ncbi:MAG: DUF4430 domain-containing protein [Acutalibacteraceae bacterium]
MKNVKKILCALTVSALVAGSFCVTAFAADEKEMTVTVRIEGISENLYYNTLSVPYNTDELTVQDVLMYIDEQNEDLTITGADIGWISAVNEDKEASFGGWDGWLYTVNNVAPVVTVSDYALSEGDSIVLYYGDPYGVGMQYPSVDTSDLSNGILTFTSEDTVYDENYNATLVVNPVTDMAVEWFYAKDGEILSVTYITDGNGQITIDKDYLTEGEHTISVGKYNEAGLPLVLRLAEDYTVMVLKNEEESSKQESSQPESSVEESKQTSENSIKTESSHIETSELNTGDSTTNTLSCLGMVSVLALIVCLTVGKKKYEE